MTKYSTPDSGDSSSAISFKTAVTASTRNVNAWLCRNTTRCSAYSRRGRQ